MPLYVLISLKEGCAMVAFLNACCSQTVGIRNFQEGVTGLRPGLNVCARAPRFLNLHNIRLTPNYANSKILQ